MRYNDTSGHWELWNAHREEWIDLYTADTSRALHLTRIYMEMPETCWGKSFWSYAGGQGLG